VVARLLMQGVFNDCPAGIFLCLSESIKIYSHAIIDAVVGVVTVQGFICSLRAAAEAEQMTLNTRSELEEHSFHALFMMHLTQMQPPKVLCSIEPTKHSFYGASD
jgi:hypothetical protein